MSTRLSWVGKNSRLAIGDFFRHHRSNPDTIWYIYSLNSEGYLLCYNVKNRRSLAFAYMADPWERVYPTFVGFKE